MRHHVRQRVRPFHPVHRQTPFERSRVQDRRITVIWCHGERMIRDDDWRTMTQPPVRDAWVGYTFSREVQPESAHGRSLRHLARRLPRAKEIELHRL